MAAKKPARGKRAGQSKPAENLETILEFTPEPKMLAALFREFVGDLAQEYGGKGAQASIRLDFNNLARAMEILAKDQDAAAGEYFDYSEDEYVENQAVIDVDGEEDDDELDFDPQPVEDTGVSFRNIGGIREIKGELERIVRFIENPAHYQAMGARLPKGVLLQGPPGVGKTLLAKAMASEAGVPFIGVSATEFDASLYGIGSARMRKLFNKAKELIAAQREEGIDDPSCIIYIDEIDVICERRGHGGSGAHTVVMMELARLMDGFEKSEGITVIASTNRPEILDPALVRPGRFDLSLDVPAPDTKGRLEILKILVRDRGIKLKTDVDLAQLAQRTYGFAGAELNLLVNEAAIIAADKKTARTIGMTDFNKAYERVLKGPRSHLEMTREEKEAIALHEAGHAIVGLRKEAQGMAKLRSVTILPHTGSLGTTYFSEDKDSYLQSKKSLQAELAVDYGGRVAEELAYGADNISSGARGDIMNATNTAWRMVTRFGFNKDLGKMRYGGADDSHLGVAAANDHGLDAGTARLVFAEMKQITDEAYDEARRILTQDYRALLALAQALMEKESLSREEVMKVTGISPGKPRQVSLSRLVQEGAPLPTQHDRPQP